MPFGCIVTKGSLDDLANLCVIVKFIVLSQMQRLSHEFLWSITIGKLSFGW